MMKGLSDMIWFQRLKSGEECSHSCSDRVQVDHLTHSSIERKAIPERLEQGYLAHA